MIGNLFTKHMVVNRRYKKLKWIVAIIYALKDLTNTNARIEPGAFIREQAIIEDGAVVTTGRTINIGAVVGEGTMIDM